MVGTKIMARYLCAKILNNGIPLTSSAHLGGHPVYCEAQHGAGWQRTPRSTALLTTLCTRVPMDLGGLIARSGAAHYSEMSV